MTARPVHQITSCGTQSRRENGLPKLKIFFSSKRETLLREREGGSHLEVEVLKRRFSEMVSYDRECLCLQGHHRVALSATALPWDQGMFMLISGRWERELTNSLVFG
jgi:hypothetical protein